MGHDEVPALELHFGIEKSEKWFATQLKPNGQHRVVDVAQAIDVAKAWSYVFFVHEGTLVADALGFNGVTSQL